MQPANKRLVTEASLVDPASTAGALLFATFGMVLKADESTDHTAAINAALIAGAAFGVKRHVSLIGAFTISGPLIVRSNTTVDARAATVTQISGSNTNMLVLDSVAPTRLTVDAVTTSGSTTITSATANFTSADVGMPVSIIGAGVAAGYGTSISPGTTNRDLYSTIVSVTSPTSAVVALPASVSLTGATLSVYKRSQNISIQGGIWDRGNNAGGGLGMHSMLLFRCDTLHVTDMVHRSTGGGKYSVWLGDVTDYAVERMEAQPSTQADFIHVSGPAYRGIVSKISGASHDDLVAVTASDVAAFAQVSGPVEDLTIEHVHGDPGAAAVVKLTGCKENGAWLKRIRVRDVSHTGTDTQNAVVKLKSDTGTLQVFDLSIEQCSGRILSDGGTIDQMTVSDCRVVPHTNSYAFITLTGTAIGVLSIDNVSNDTPTASVGPLVMLDALTTAPYNVGASIGVLDISNAHWTVLNGYLIVFIAASVVLTKAKLSNVTHLCTSGGGGLVQANVAGETLGDLYLSNVTTESSAFIFDLATTTRLWLDNVRAPGIGRVRATGAITIRGAAIDITATNLTVDSGGSIRSMALDLPVDVSKLTKTAGDRATNTNAALACGVGPVVSDGTSWKNLFSGATF